MSIPTRFLLTHGAALLIVLSPSLLVASSNVITIDERPLTLKRHGNTLQAIAVGQPEGEAFSADAALSHVTRGAIDAFVLANRTFENAGHRYFLLAISKPSVERGGTGFCGAGTEDHVLLVEWVSKERTMKLRDDLLVQSCLKSITLASDQGNSLKAALGSISQPEPLELTWLTHPTYEGETYRFSVQGGKWNRSKQ